MSGGTRVTVVVPARDERHDIAACVEAIAAQTQRPFEVLVVDGNSGDGTAEVAEQALRSHGLDGRVLVNSEGSTPSNLNAGLAAAAGEIICRVDAHSLIPPDYIERCAAVLDARPDVMVVGGAQVAVPRSPGARDLGIARALNNRWGMGFARYRRDAGSGPADTAYLGVFRTDDLREAGGWNLRFPTNQDFELSRRMGARGVVWFESGLPVGYRPRREIRQLARQYHRFGRWKVRYWQITGDRPRPRQLVLLAAPPVAAAVGLTALVVVPARGRLALLGSAVVVGGIVEVSGAREPAAGPAGHVVSLVASGVVAGSWLSGVVRELASSARRTADLGPSR